MVYDLPDEAAEPQQPAATDAAFLKCEHGDDGVVGDSPAAAEGKSTNMSKIPL